MVLSLLNHNFARAPAAIHWHERPYGCCCSDSFAQGSSVLAFFGGANTSQAVNQSRSLARANKPMFLEVCFYRKIAEGDSSAWMVSPLDWPQDQCHGVFAKLVGGGGHYGQLAW
jgi:hypothetical protein